MVAIDFRLRSSLVGPCLRCCGSAAGHGLVILSHPILSLKKRARDLPSFFLHVLAIPYKTIQQKSLSVREKDYDGNLMDRP